jgi:outer membrane receptor for ferrienterochelin and colicins
MKLYVYYFSKGDKGMFLKFISMLSIGLLIYSAAFAGGGKIAGIVNDADTGQPLPWTSIVIEGTNFGTGTDLDGRFEITNIALGEYNVIASAIGFRTQLKKVKLNSKDDVLLDFKLEDSPLELTGVVVTGTRTPRYIKEAPIYTEVITKKAISNKSAHNLYDALEGAPGIRVEQQCQACNFSVLRMQGLGADHTQILLDGLPIYSGLASVYGLQQISTSDIDQIEIVKGAGSALYGSNAVAGAINIISSVPYKTEGQIGMEVGEYGTNKYDITAGIRKDDIGLFLFAQQDRGDAIDETGDGMTSDEVRNPDGLTDRVRTNNKSAGFNVFIDNVSEMDRLTLRGRILNETRQGGELTNDAFENPFTPGAERIITDRYSVEVGYHKSFKAGNELSAGISATRHKRNATNDTFLGDYEATHNDSLPPVDELRPYLADENLIVLNINYIHPPVGGKHRILIGAQYSHNKLNESGKYIASSNPISTDYGVAYTSYSEKKANEFGIYIQDEFAVMENIEIVGGFRFDYHKSEDNFRGSGSIMAQGLPALEYNESTVNPRFAIRFNATPELTLRGSFGTGFRVPYGFSEDLHLCSGSPRVYKGADLKPEKSMSYGVTADYTTSVMGLNLNLYRTDLKNKIDFADSDNSIANLGYTYQWENIDNGHVMGVEAGTQFAITNDLAAGLNFAYNIGEYDNPRSDWVGTNYEDMSKKFSRYPEIAGGAKVEYSPFDWTFILDMSYKGKMYIDYTEAEDPSDIKIKETESFVILNARVSKTFFDRYNLYIGAKNLTDYIQEEKHTDDAAFLYAPVYGRMFYGGVQIML